MILPQIASEYPRIDREYRLLIHTLNNCILHTSYLLLSFTISLIVTS
jgi:hypothetical protein